MDWNRLGESGLVFFMGALAGWGTILILMFVGIWDCR
jgi:hypothetical protein